MFAFGFERIKIKICEGKLLGRQQGSLQTKNPTHQMNLALKYSLSFEGRGDISFLEWNSFVTSMHQIVLGKKAIKLISHRPDYDNLLITYFVLMPLWLYRARQRTISETIKNR